MQRTKFVDFFLIFLLLIFVFKNIYKNRKKLNKILTIDNVNEFDQKEKLGFYCTQLKFPKVIVNYIRPKSRIFGYG